MVKVVSEELLSVCCSRLENGIRFSFHMQRIVFIYTNVSIEINYIIKKLLTGNEYQNVYNKDPEV